MTATPTKASPEADASLSSRAVDDGFAPCMDDKRPSPAAPVGGEPVAWVEKEHPKRPSSVANERKYLQANIKNYGPGIVSETLSIYALAQPEFGSFAGSLWALSEWAAMQAHPAPTPNGDTDQGPGEAWKPGREDVAREIYDYLNERFPDGALPGGVQLFAHAGDHTDASMNHEAGCDELAGRILALRPSADGKVKP